MKYWKPIYKDKKVQENIKTLIEYTVYKNWNDFIEKNKDFYRLATFKHMLAYIYFHSLDKFKLDEELEKIMLVYLKKY